MEPYTHGAIYALSHICMEPYTHGAIYAWSCICMEPYMHGAVYAWSRICMEPYTCGASSLPLLPACSPSIPGSLELSWGLRKPPAHSPCFQLTTLTPSLLPLLPGLLGPQEAPSFLPLLPACCPCSQSIPGSLQLSWGLRKPPAHFPCPQLAPLTPSLLPLLPEHPWAPGTSLRPQETPSSLPLLPEHPWVSGIFLGP